MGLSIRGLLGNGFPIISKGKRKRREKGCLTSSDDAKKTEKSSGSRGVKAMELCGAKR